MSIAGSFLEWIDRPNSHKIYFADMRLAQLSVSAGTPETVAFYAATEDFLPPPGSIIEYDGYLAGIPRYERRMQEVFFGRSFPSFGQLTLHNDKGTLDELFSKSFTKDQDITIRLGGPPSELRYAHFGTVLHGIMGQQILHDDTIDIPVFDDQRKFKRRIPTDTFTVDSEGTNFPSGSAVPAPLIYGEVHNIKPILVDKALLKYKVANHAVQAIGTVYDNGININNNVTVNLNDGSFTLNAQSVGEVTADVLGRKHPNGAYSGSIGDVVEALLIQEARFSNDNIDQACIKQFKTDVPYTVGVFIDTPTTILDVLDELTRGLLVFYGISRIGKFQIKKFTPPSGDPKIIFADDVEILEPEITYTEPFWQVQLGFDRNYTVLPTNSVAGSVTFERRAWLSQPLRHILVEKTSTKDLFNFSEAESVIETSLVRSTDATTVANDRLAIVERSRKIIIAPFGVQPTQLDLGDVVELTRTRYNVSGKFKVIGIQEDYIENQITLELFQ